MNEKQQSRSSNEWLDRKVSDKQVNNHHNIVMWIRKMVLMESTEVDYCLILTRSARMGATSVNDL